MADWVYVVTGHGQIWVFDDEDLAERFANARGGCERESCCVISEHEGEAMIRVWRMRRAGL